MWHPEKFQSKQSSGTFSQQPFLIIYSGPKPNSSPEQGGSELLHYTFVALEPGTVGAGQSSVEVLWKQIPEKEIVSEAMWGESWEGTSPTIIIKTTVWPWGFALLSFNTAQKGVCTVNTHVPHRGHTEGRKD